MKLIDDIKEKVQGSPLLNSPLFLRNKHLVVPGVVLILSLLILGLVTLPQFFKLFDTYKQINELSAKRSFFQEKTAKLENLDVDLYRKNLDTALIALPVDKDIPGVTGELLVALSGSGMTLEAITYAGGASDPTKISEYTLRLDITGKEADLKNFLGRVKLLPRIVKMVSLDAGKSKGMFSVSVSFVTLYQPLPENIGTVEEKIPEITDEDAKVLADIRTKADALPQTTGGGTSTGVGKLNPFAP